jgi:hypothetical protein
MKNRQGFVSNSSSTSFIVCVPKNEKLEELPKMEKIPEMVEYSPELKTKCDICGKDIMVEFFQSGECPYCGAEYEWEEYCDCGPVIIFTKKG